MEMKKARFAPVLAAFSVFSSCALSLLVVPAVPAAAVDWETVRLTPGQTRALFGDSLNGTYYDYTTGDYVGITFDYLGVTTIDTVYARESDGGEFLAAAPSGTQFIIYQSSVQGLPDCTDNNYYSVQLEPILNLGMLNQISLVAGFSQTAFQELVSGSDHEYYWTTGKEASYTNSHATGYPKNYVEYDLNGDHYIRNALQRWTTNSNIVDWLSWAVASTSQTNTRFFVPLVINVQNDSFFSFQNLTLTRQGQVKATTSNSSRTLLYISCPSLSTRYQENGSGGGSGSGSGSSADLTATNAKLDTIISILSMIAMNQGSGSGSNEDYLDSESPSDSSALNQADSKFQNELSAADQQQQRIDSVVNHDNLDSVEVGTNEYDVDPAFMDLWTDGNGGTNDLILGMTLIPITIAVIAYILFGKRI